MTSLSKRLPMIPRLQAASPEPHETVQPYLNWELLEVNEKPAEILICKPCGNHDVHTRSKNLLILPGKLARVWLQSQDVAHV